MPIFTNSVHTSPIASHLVNYGNDHNSIFPVLVRDESSSFRENGDDFSRIFQYQTPRQQCDELLQSIVDSSCSVSSTPFKGLEDSGRQRDLEIDLNKTPEHRPPNRREYTPIVYSEEKFSDLLNSPLEESLSFYEETQLNSVTAVLDEATQKRHDELLKDLTDTLSAAIYTQCGEIKEIEKGSDQVIDLNNTPEQKPPKRRKHRPKVITEGKPKRSYKPVTPKNSKETPSGKRKYVRKKNVKESSTPPTTVVEAKNVSSATKIKSCRRELKFDKEKVGDEDQGKKQGEKDMQEGNMRNFSFITRPNISDLFTRSNDVCGTISDVHIHQHGMIDENLQPTLQTNLAGANLMMTPFISPSWLVAVDPLNKSAREKYQNGFSNGYTSVQQHIRADSSVRFVNQAKQSTYYNDRIDLNTECFQTMPQAPKPVSNMNEARGSKRGYTCTTQETHMYSINTLDSSLLSQEALQIDGCHRQGGRLDLDSFPFLGKDSEPGLYATIFKRYSAVQADEGCSKYINTRGLNSVNSVGFATEMKQSILNGHVRSNHTVEQNNCTKEMSGEICINSVVNGNKFQREQTSHTLHPSGSLITFEKCNKLQPYSHFRASEQEYACRQSNGSMSRKRKGGQPIRTTLGMLESVEIRELNYSYGYQEFTNKAGQLVNDITCRLRDLNLNGTEKNALVPYKGNGPVVPYVESDYIKKRKARPKVDLDAETERVWNFLMGKEEGSVEDEKDKAKWWEEERKVFRGRADSFIARMHLVQGDRRFSLWKGSVVDSVIGVFLTQNVSDHLSSNAFISLAARFPLKSTGDNRSQGEMEKSIVSTESAACELYREDSIRWNGGQVESLHSFAMPHTLIDHHNHREISGTEINSMEAGGQIVEEVLSSQDSFESTITQGIGGDRSCSGSNSETEEPIFSCNCDNIHSSSFTNINQMEATIMLQKPFVNLDTSLGFDQATEYENQQLPDGKLGSLTSEWDEIDDLSGHSLFSFLVNIDKNNQKKQLQVSPSNNQQQYTTSSCGVLEVLGREAFSEESISSGPSIASGLSPEKNTPQLTLNIGEFLGILDKTVAKENGQASFERTTTTRHSESVGEHSVNLLSNEIQAGLNGHPLDNFTPSPRGMNKHVNASVTYASIDSVAPAKMQESALCNAEHVPAHTHKSIDVENRMAGKNNQIQVTNDEFHSSSHVNTKGNVSSSTPKRRKVIIDKKDAVDWDSLRKQVKANGQIKEKSKDAVDSLDYEALRTASTGEIAEAIKERGMNNLLADRMKEFLNRLVRDHGSVDLEWLREVPPDKAKDYLLSVRGLGLKSVECVRLLTLHHLAFPVDTNVGRIAVRLGWVPLKPLPESLQIHLLELYPVLESIQKYLWPRLCKLDQRTLYELHYQLITFGKVFCTKHKPNCNACPMRGECKHFASAFASARLALPAPDERRIVTSSTNPIAPEKEQPAVVIHPLPILPPDASTYQATNSRCEPIIEVPATPEPEVHAEVTESDMEDFGYEDPDEIPTIKLSLEEFRTTLQDYIPEGDMSNALVALNAQAASIPMPKLKDVTRLRTEHRVYELPDTHPLLEGMDKREPDDPSPYLFAIWTPGETADSIKPPEYNCSSQDPNKLCDEKTCYTCNSKREANSQIVRGTILIPCRTAMHGSFPLNGTYFQVNEMFADHESSHNPIVVPRTWLWNLPRRTVYFGTSVTTIFRGLTTEGIQQCFWRGFVCVRGFDRKYRAPRPLIARLHYPASKLARAKNGE